MAQSVKLKDGSLIDTSAIYDANEGKTQQEVNASKLDKTGGTVTGDLVAQTRILGNAGASTGYGSIAVIPMVRHSTLGTTDTKPYFKELPKWVCANCVQAEVYIGMAHPNSQGNVILSIPEITNVDSDGYPLYAMGLYVGLDGRLFNFGFINGTYFYRSIDSTAV